MAPFGITSSERRRELKSHSNLIHYLNMKSKNDSKSRLISSCNNQKTKHSGRQLTKRPKAKTDYLTPWKKCLALRPLLMRSCINIQMCSSDWLLFVTQLSGLRKTWLLGNAIRSTYDASSFWCMPFRIEQCRHPAFRCVVTWQRPLCKHPLSSKDGFERHFISLVLAFQQRGMTLHFHNLAIGANHALYTSMLSPRSQQRH